MTSAFAVLPGGGPILVHVPHAGLAIPDDVRAELLLDDAALADELLRMTDHGTAELAMGLGELGATLLVNRTSRLVVDVERHSDPADEPMERIGMGAVYTRTSSLAPLRDGTPARMAAVREALVARFHAPWHAALTEEVGRIVALHGLCTIVDLHTYPSIPLPYEADPTAPRPEVCIGTDPRATPERLARHAETVLAAHGFATARDTPFAGALTPAQFAGDSRVRSVMIEVRRDVVVDEATGRPREHLGGLRAAIAELVAGLTLTPV